jgi:diaminohydroxyphosphoribosylaminopyrimidine deaminase/5-amino-6-(5-phosphoribosylamino)uracil reductase
MAAALALAARGLGNVWPNPAVGCVLVRDGHVVGRGWTRPGGRPHAETEALRRAGKRARGATAYVSLEPCAHQGETPPCAEALALAGICRAVVALEDPDPRVDGAGTRLLSEAGIEVDAGVCAEAAAEINAGFVMRAKRGRPLVTVKTATSLDGRIATRGGESQWITGPEARACGHALRARHDAVLTGIGTVLADDPELTCRLPGMAARSPVRVVVDSRLKLPADCKLVAGAQDIPTWVIVVAGVERDRGNALTDRGVEVIEVAADEDDEVDLAAAAEAMAARGLTRVLVEGGGVLTAALFRARLVDRVAWFRAPRLIGGDGISAAGSLDVDRLPEAPSLRRLTIAEVGDDLLETYAVEA